MLCAYIYIQYSLKRRLLDDSVYGIYSSRVTKCRLDWFGQPIFSISGTAYFKAVIKVSLFPTYL